MSTVIDPMSPAQGYYSDLGEALLRHTKFDEGDIVYDIELEVPKINNWKPGMAIEIMNTEGSTDDLEYDARSGNVTHKPTDKVILMLNKGLDPNQVDAAFWQDR